MKIVLIRHGESEHNAGLVEHKDSPLTEKGKTQAKHLGLKLKKIKISGIYTSNLKRAKETAEIISKIIHVPIKASFEELNEYPQSMLKSFFKTLFNNRLKKLKKFLSSIARDRKKNKTVLIVAHGTTNRIVMACLLDIPLKKQLLRFHHHNTGLIVLHWNNSHKNWNIQSFNDISHLPKKLKENNYL